MEHILILVNLAVVKGCIFYTPGYCNNLLWFWEICTCHLLNWFSCYCIWIEIGLCSNSCTEVSHKE